MCINEKQPEVTEEQYEEMLNDCYEAITICGMSYGQGTALKHLDPIAFCVGMSDYESELISDWEDEQSPV